MSGVFRSEEEPVLRTQLGGVYGVLDEVVVDLPAYFEIKWQAIFATLRFKSNILRAPREGVTVPQAVGKSYADEALLSHRSSSIRKRWAMSKTILAACWSRAMSRARRSCANGAERHGQERTRRDAKGCDRRRASNVGEAEDELGPRVGIGVRFVDFVAVALDVTAKCFAESLDELIRSAANAPVVEMKKMRPFHVMTPHRWSAQTEHKMGPLK